MYEICKNCMYQRKTRKYYWCKCTGDYVRFDYRCPSFERKVDMDDLLNGTTSGTLYYYDKPTGTYKKIGEGVTIDLPVDETYYAERLADREDVDNGNISKT